MRVRMIVSASVGEMRPRALAFARFGRAIGVSP
jgi:hypothetical protein